MKTIITGSKSISNYVLIEEAVYESKFEITEVISGGSFGIDHLGEIYAEKYNLPIKIFPASWDQLGYSAGPLRNKEMAEYADALIILIDTDSRDTKNMIDIAKASGLRVYIKYINNSNSLDNFFK